MCAAAVSATLRIVPLESYEDPVEATHDDEGILRQIPRKETVLIWRKPLCHILTHPLA